MFLLSKPTTALKTAGRINRLKVALAPYLPTTPDRNPSG